MTLDEMRGLKSQLEKLLDSQGWRTHAQSIEEQVRLRRQNVFGLQVRGLDDAFSLAREQGEVAGLLLSLAIPSARILDLQTDIQRALTAERESAEDEETTV